MARILVADDELDLVEVLAEILRDEGHDVHTAVDGLDALKDIREWHPDLAVLDVDMPHLSGPSIAAALSREERLGAIPIVLLSGNADLERVAANSGISYCVTKPVAPDKLMSVLDSALAHRPASP